MRHAMIDTMTQRLQRGLDTAMKLGADAAKLSFYQSEKSGPSFENGRLKNIEISQGQSYSIEILLKGKRGNASGNTLDDLDTLIARAVSLAKVGSDAHFTAYPAPAPVHDIKTWSESTVNLTMDDMIDACRLIVDRLKSYNADLFIEAGAGKSESEDVLVTSGGVSHASRATGWSLGAFCQHTDGTDMLFAGDGRHWRAINAFFDPESIARKIIDDLKHGETIVNAPNGTCPAFLPPDVLARVMYPFYLGINGRNVAKGDSPLKGRLGEQVFDPNLTLIDDPFLDYAYGVADMDSDGIPAQRHTIIENGVLKMFLYDLDSAGLAGVEPTGNSGCSPYSPVVSPGKKHHDELLAGIEDGIVIKQLLGFGQSNIINGDFSSNLGLGYRVKNGRIIGRVKNTMVSGNLYDLFKRGVEFSSDIDAMRRMPWAVVQDMTVSTPNG